MSWCLATFGNYRNVARAEAAQRLLKLKTCSDSVGRCRGTGRNQWRVCRAETDRILLNFGTGFDSVDSVPCAPSPIMTKIYAFFGVFVCAKSVCQTVFYWVRCFAYRHCATIWRRGWLCGMGCPFKRHAMTQSA